MIAGPVSKLPVSRQTQCEIYRKFGIQSTSWFLDKIVIFVENLGFKALVYVGFRLNFSTHIQQCCPNAA